MAMRACGVALLGLFLLGLVAPGPARADDAALVRGQGAPPGAIWAETLDLTKISQGWGKAHVAKTIIDLPLTLKGVVYPHGVGTHAESTFAINLKGVCERFVAMAGLDDETKGPGSIAFEMWVDDVLVAESGVMRYGNEPKLMSVDLTGKRSLELVVTDAGDGNGFDHADWAGALLFVKAGAQEKPEVVSQPVSENEPQLPIASGTSPEPAIHGARIIGATPGRPFLYLIPATGESPLTYEAKPLPEGLVLDTHTGIISGALKNEGSTAVEITVTGPKGKASRELNIVGKPHALALTPPMGWNSWYVWAGLVDDAKMRAAADAMVSSGLAAHGYQYINIDDCWEAGRDANGEIQSNERFPDMKALGDYLHAKGLKFGIYTSPGPKTCAGFTGSYQHEEQDARTYAAWGVDFVKHDWCSYGSLAKDNSVAECQKPYRVMQAALENSGRDMVYSLCQYGMGDVWKWGAEVGANLWRTTGDSGDTWGNVAGIGFKQNGLEAYAGPGHWNDPDMIQVGKLGMAAQPRDTHLSRNEQIAQMTLWSIVASPLLLSCDLAQLDAFTLALLTNDEVLDVNQDPLGKQGSLRVKNGRTEVWARPLSDGTLAVGLFNRAAAKRDVTVRWANLGLKGPQSVRDLWQKKDLGTFDDGYTVQTPGHGAIMIRVGTPK